MVNPIVDPNPGPALVVTGMIMVFRFENHKRKWLRWIRVQSTDWLGIRMLDQPYMTDLIEANSMGHEPDLIDIYSAR